MASTKLHHKSQRRVRHVLCSLMLLAFSYCLSARADDIPRLGSLLAVKSDRVLVLFDDQGQEIDRFPAAFGQAKGNKVVEGDLRTPEGDYFVMPARPSGNWTWFMLIDYPNKNDVARAKREGRKPTNLGGNIGIHPVKGFLRNIRQSFGDNWTFGCIAIDESDMDVLRTLVTMPVPIRIQP
jgi:murein L,D-transpeptidase YafK